MGAGAHVLELRAVAGQRWLAIGACALAFFTICQDAQMVVSALPRLGHDLGLDPASAVWLVLAGSVTTVGLLLPAGRWADASGNRTAFLVGTLGFAAAAGLAGLAPSVPWLLAARALEGGFSALLLVLVMTVAVEAAGPAGRAQAIGVITAAGPLGSMTGPQLAALLLPAFGWRSVFLVALPLCLLATLVGLAAVPGETHAVRPRARWLMEAGALTAAVGALFLLLRELPKGTAGLPLEAGLAAVVVTGVAAWGRLPQAHGLLRLVAARHLALPLGALANMALGNGFIAFAVPYFLIGQLHAGLQVAALTFIALAFGMTLASAVGGTAMMRWGSARVALAGAVLLALGMVLLMPLDPGWNAVDVAWRMGLIGVGCGFVAGSNQSTVMGLAPWHHESAASAVSGVVRNLSYAIGAAGASVLVAFAPTPMAGLRLALGIAVLAAAGGIVAAYRARHVMEGLDQVDHHPVAHASHAALHRLDGLARDPEHPEYVEPEPLHVRRPDAAAGGEPIMAHGRPRP